MRRGATHVIFDMDGVLLDTERLYTQATQQIVSQYGKTFDWSIKGNMIGRPALDSARYLVEALALPMSPEAYLAERAVLFEELMPTAAAMPGARALTDALGARGIPMAVASARAATFRAEDHAPSRMVQRFRHDRARRRPARTARQARAGHLPGRSGRTRRAAGRVRRRRGCRGWPPRVRPACASSPYRIRPCAGIAS
jgi:beta-phosphoglucomutase-like phosphatase (HAD superfamily)